MTIEIVIPETKQTVAVVKTAKETVSSAWLKRVTDDAAQGKLAAFTYARDSE